MKIPLHLILIYFLCRIHPRPTMSDEVFCEELDKSPFHRDRYRGFLSVPTGSQNAIFLILIIHSKTCVCKSNNTYEKNLLLTKQKKRTRAFWRMPSNYLHYLIFFILQLRYASSLLLLALLPSLQQLPSAYHAQSEP